MRKPLPLPITCLLVLAFSYLSLYPLFADSASSTNYRLAQFDHTLGSEDLQYGGMYGYKVEEANLDLVEVKAASSTNYSTEGKIGVDGAEGIPVINSVTPGPISRNFTDESPSFTVSASNSDAQTLNYEAKQDGTLKDGPQTTNPLTWALVAGDRGRRTVTFNVSDTTGTVRQDQPLYAFRRPTK